MRFVSMDSSEALIEAMVSEKNDANVFHVVAFKASAVDYVMSVNDNISALVLNGNLTIPVVMPFQRLKHMIYEPDFKDGLFIDLIPVTGKAVKDILVPKLADEFNEMAKPLIISAFLRRKNTNDVIKFDFAEASIVYYRPESHTRSKTEHSVIIQFNSSGKLPFNNSEACLDMPFENFTAALMEAKKKGQSGLDLCSLFAANPEKYGFNPQ